MEAVDDTIKDEDKLRRLGNIFKPDSLREFSMRALYVYILCKYAYVNMCITRQGSFCARSSIILALAQSEDDQQRPFYGQLAAPGGSAALQDGRTGGPKVHLTRLSLHIPISASSPVSAHSEQSLCCGRDSSL